MTTLYEGAFAKVNLTLDVLGKREDGYHDLQSVMQTISIRDDVEIDVGTGKPWVLECSREDIPCGPENLAWKAAKVFCDSLKIDPNGLAIRITKRIPTGAGLGGGSADAAAVLRALNRHFDSPLSILALAELGARVGSDVPFCVSGGTALAEGRGERLTALPALPDCWIVLCKPEFGIPTPALFTLADAGTPKNRPDIDGMIRALSAGDLDGVAARLCNVFEEFLPEEYHEVFHIKNRLLELGALNAAMSGSGPTVFGIFREETAAKAALTALKQRYPQTYLAKPVGKLV